MANVADIIVNLVTKTGSFDRGMTSGQRRLKQFDKGARQVQRTVRSLSGALAGLGVGVSLGGLAALTKRAIDLNDELGKMATRLGVGTADLRELQIAADLSGQKVQALNIGLQRMVRRVNEAAVGTGEAQQAIKDLGLDAEELAGLDAGEIFRRISEPMANVASQGQRIQLAFKLLDSEGVGLVNTMALLSSGGFQEVAESARRMNAVLNDFETAQFEVAQDAVTLIGLAFEGMRNTIAQAVLPAVLVLRDGIVSVAEEAGDVGENIADTRREFVAALGVVVGIFRAMQTLGLVVTAVGLRIQKFIINPIARAQQGIARLANSVPGIRIDPDSFGAVKVVEFLDETIDNLDRQIAQYDGIVGEATEIVQAWDAAVIQLNQAAAETARQREEQRQIGDELQRQLEERKRLAAVESEATRRQTAFNTAISSTTSRAQQLADRIALVNENLISGEFVRTQEDRARAMQALTRLTQDLIAAQREEAGLTTAADRAREVESILGGLQSEAVTVAQRIAVLNEAIVAGEGDRNQLLAAREELVRRLIVLQTEETEGVGRLTEVTVQAVRNMQTGLADFFATAKGGFGELLRGFVQMLRRMVAELLARRILLSFLGFLSKGTGGLASFAKAVLGKIEGRQRGGPLRAGQVALVGEEGPELFVPRAAGAVVSNRDLTRFAEEARERAERDAAALRRREAEQTTDRTLEAARAARDSAEERRRATLLRAADEASRGRGLARFAEVLAERRAPASGLIEVSRAAADTTDPGVGRLTEVLRRAAERREREEGLRAAVAAAPEGGLVRLTRELRDQAERDEAATTARRAAGGTPEGALAGFATELLRRVERRQRGGPLRAGQAALVGEREPELFLPDESGFVTPLRALEAFTSGLRARLQARLQDALASGVASLGRALMDAAIPAQFGADLRAGQLALVGEAGPEFFVPKQAGSVVSRDSMRSVVINVTQNNTFNSEGAITPAQLIPILEENGRKVKAEMLDALDRGQFR